jgi:hypothetical protein
LKPFLLEVSIRRESLSHITTTHEDEAHSVAQRITLVWPHQEQIHCFSVQNFVNPDTFNIRAACEITHKGQSGLPRKTTEMSKRDKLGENVAVRQAD